MKQLCPDINVEFHDLTAEDIEHIEQGLADGSIVPGGTFGDVPPIPGLPHEPW